MGHRSSLGLVEPLQQLVHPALFIVNLGRLGGRRIRNFREGMHRTSESMPTLRQDPATPRWPVWAAARSAWTDGRRTQPRWRPARPPAAPGPTVGALPYRP